MQLHQQNQANVAHRHIPPVELLFDGDDEGDELSLYSAADDPLLIRQIFEYYRDTLLRTPRALRYLQQERGLNDPNVIEAFHIGFSDRTLGFRLPNARRVEGGAMRGHLQRIGLLRPSGHELFRGSLVFPVFDEHGSVVDAYGRKITPRLRAGTDYHVSLADEPRGVFNQAALACSGEIILCKSPLEAATFWCAKFRNVIATMGLRGFTDELLNAFAQHGVGRVYVAFDSTPAGDRAARLVAQALSLIGTNCRRLLFPPGLDANAFARANASPTAAFAALLRAARPCRQSYEAIKGDGQCG